MAVVQEYGTPRTYLQAVQLVCQMTGVVEPQTLAGADRNTIRAMLAVKSALNTVWYAHSRWPWRWRWSIIEAVAGQMWYELPLGYSASGSTLGLHKTTGSLTFKPYEWLAENVPYIRNLPPEYGDEDTEAETVAAEYNGVPAIWTIQGGYIGLWYPPSQDFIDATSSKLIIGYYRDLIEPAEDEDEMGLPVDLLPAHENISLATFHRYREIPDWKVTMEIGMGQLAKCVAMARRVFLESAQITMED